MARLVVIGLAQVDEHVIGGIKVSLGIRRGDVVHGDVGLGSLDLVGGRSLLLGSGRIGLLLGVVGIARATSEDAARKSESAYDSENLLHHGEASPYIDLYEIVSLQDDAESP